MSMFPAIDLKKIEISSNFIQSSFKVCKRLDRSWKKHYKQIFAVNQGDKTALGKVKVFVQGKILEKV